MKVRGFFRHIRSRARDALLIRGSWRASLFIFIFALIVVIFFALLIKDPNFATACAAFGTLILALVTVLSVQSNIEKNKRDREERLLVEIIEWAQWVYTLVLGYPSGTREHIRNTFGSLQTIRARQVSLAKLAKERLNEGLATQISNTRPLLDRFIECVECSMGELAEVRSPLPAGIDEAMIKLIEDASALRAKL